MMSGVCATCGTELIGPIGSFEGWTRHGCPMGALNDDETEWPCREEPVDKRDVAMNLEDEKPDAVVTLRADLYGNRGGSDARVILVSDPSPGKRAVEPRPRPRMAFESGRPDGSRWCAWLCTAVRNRLAEPSERARKCTAVHAGRASVTQTVTHGGPPE